MWHVLSGPWPWYVGGPIIGLMVPALLLMGNKSFGVSSALRAICAATVPGRLEFFRYDWTGTGLWNVALALGILIGGALAVGLLRTDTARVAHRPVSAVGVGGLIPYVILGALFGIVLVKSEIVSWYRIQEMFRFQSFHMYGVMGSAMLTAMLSLRVMKAMNATFRGGEATL